MRRQSTQAVASTSMEEIPFPISEKLYEVFSRCREKYAVNNRALESKIGDFLSREKRRQELFRLRTNSHWVKLRGLFQVISIIKGSIFKKKLHGSSSGLDKFSLELPVMKKLAVYRWISGFPLHQEVYRSRKWYILYEDSLFLRVWSFIIVILFSYTVVYLPYKISFLEESYGFFSMLDWVANIAFMVDIAVSMLSQYSESGEMIDELRPIVSSYIKSWFFLDLFSVIPIETFLGRSLGLGIMMKFMRLMKIAKIFRLLKISDTISKNRVFRRAVQFFNINRQFSDFVLFFLFIILMTHITGCLWFFLTKLEDSETSWIEDVQYQKASNLNIYVMSIYWAISTICTVGFGDVVPKTITEKLFNIVWICVGVAFYSYTLGTLSSILNASNLQRSIASSRFALLYMYAKEKKIDTSLLEKITINLEFLEEGSSLPKGEESLDFLADVSVNLTYDLAKHIHRDLIERVLVFRNKDTNFVAQLIPHISTRRFRAGEVVYNAHEYPLFVYFLTSGKVGFSEESSRVFKMFVQGSYFGEVEIFKSCLRNFRATAMTDCTTLLLPRKNFVEELQNFPDIFEELLLTAIKRDILNKKNAKFAERTHLINLRAARDPDLARQFAGLQAKSHSNICEMKAKLKALVSEFSQQTFVDRALRFRPLDSQLQVQDTQEEFDDELDELDDLNQDAFTQPKSLDFYLRSITEKFEQINRRVMASKREAAKMLSALRIEKTLARKRKFAKVAATQFDSLEGFAHLPKNFSDSSTADLQKTKSKASIQPFESTELSGFKLELESLGSLTETVERDSPLRNNFVKKVKIERKDIFLSTETKRLKSIRD